MLSIYAAQITDNIFPFCIAMINSNTAIKISFFEIYKNMDTNNVETKNNNLKVYLCISVFDPKYVCNQISDILSLGSDQDVVMVIPAFEILLCLSCAHCGEFPFCTLISNSELFSLLLFFIIFKWVNNK